MVYFSIIFLVSFSIIIYITTQIAEAYSRSKLLDGDVLLSIRGTIGRVAIVPEILEGANITQDTARISLKDSINNVFIKGVLESPSIQAWISMRVVGLAVKGINLKDVRDIPIPLVDEGIQQNYVSIVQQADKSKFALKKSIEKIDNVIKALMQ